MIFFFIAYVSSALFELNEDNLEQTISNSNNVSLVIFFFSGTCPECVGIPEAFRNFSRRYAWRNDLLFSMINCTASPDYCQFFDMKNVPSFLYVNTPDPYYWQISQNKKTWKYFIDTRVTGKISYAKNNTILTEAITKTIFGFSTYHLVVNSFVDPYIHKMQNITSIYHKLGPSFVYTVDPAAPEPMLYIYRSTRCNTTIKLSEHTDEEIMEIVKQSYRSHFMHYSYFEFMNELYNKETFLFLLRNETVEDGLFTGKFVDVSEKYCSDFNFGWSGVLKENSLLEAIGYNEDEVQGSKYLYLNPKSKCSFLLDIEKNTSEIFDEIEKDRYSIDCHKYQSTTSEEL